MTHGDCGLPHSEKPGQRMFAPPDYWAVCYLGLARADLRRRNATWPINPLPKSINVPGSGVVAGMGVVGIKVLEDAVQTV